jgi:hypothetical protein
MVVDRPWKPLHFLLLSVVLLISSQQPLAVQHFKSTTESTMSVTPQIVYSAITAIRNEAYTTHNKWMTLDAWKTIMFHYYDFDDDMGFSVNTLTRAVKTFGTEVESKVSQGNTTGVHLRLKFFVEYDQNGEKSGTQKVRFLLLTDSTAKDPKEPIDISGWKREYENSKAVVDKTSSLFVGVRALPSFENRASGRGHLNEADLEISEQRKLVKPPTPRVVSPIQGATGNLFLPIQGDQTRRSTRNRPCL